MNRRLIHMIQVIVVEHYSITLLELLSTKVPRHLTHIRQVAMWLAYDMGAGGHLQIGSAFGRNHSTIIHGVEAIEKRKNEDKYFAKELETLRKNVNTLMGVE